MPLLLTADEIEAVTGLKQPSAQLRWLRRHGWKAHANARGAVVVDRRHYETKMLGSTEVAAAPMQPNFAALVRK